MGISPGSTTQPRWYALLTRRSALGAGTAFIAALATLTTSKSVLAEACQNPNCGFGVGCCCPGSNSCCELAECGGWNCPEGFQETCWSCQKSGQWWLCGECSSGSKCHDGPFGCSYVVPTPSNGCPV